ncbi:predicted protein, partial [Haematococcus lacustris]
MHSAAQREAAQERRAAEKARRELEELSQQQLPRTRADFQAQLSKARNETARMKEQLKDAEAAAADKDAQIHRLTATIQSLQLAGSQAADTELAGLRVKVAQLETTLKAKDVQLEKL